MNVINSNEQMIEKINEVLQKKKDAIVNIVNDKLTISVFSLLEKNLKNVKEINFVIRDVKFLPHQSEIAHEFEINPTDVLFNAYDITEKNKFPNMELNEYLGLEARVKGKMTTLNLVSTGDEDVLTPEMNDFNFRKRQLERLKDEVIDIEDANDNISLTDLNMNEYLNELSEYIQNVPEIKKVPQGVYSVTDGGDAGVLFCFKHRNDVNKPKSDSSLYPYYLIYMKNNGEVLYGNGRAREVVKQFRRLCYGKCEPVMELFQKFFVRTDNAKNMQFYSNLLNKSIKSIKGEEESKATQLIFDFGGFNNAFADETVDDFELISFLVVE